MGILLEIIMYTQYLGIPQFCILENHTKYALKGKNRVDSWEQTKYLNQVQLDVFSPGIESPNKLLYPSH